MFLHSLVRTFYNNIIIIIIIIISWNLYIALQ